MPCNKINRNAYLFEEIAEQDITLDVEVILDHLGGETTLTPNINQPKLPSVKPL